ncbi:MAG: flagellar biosynthesis protein FlhA [Hyphomonas sp.]|uniref:flagellar biosynthesis protein FlhA n=1 Tax=Hyphomonas sp. TaxID=87 RepID=UPI0017D2DB9A|nr:flagellar biosynthesis protein FlhA [Hyphomonas sp.]MBA3067894.1 flagellar biosynthesis protein FlhA [Hyphomonas sp.]MBU3921795.1 flagellar biosynthesis protein FlhA [Alphaproteobacteria bacterium]MBU4062450.1 flagellar biosynthesis protein FlhA [Alphaproteobacteria bacterium]MBU4165941.1 flagellar biosynthesis protein FlhA [Alphaproteobacteria bacterium]
MPSTKSYGLTNPTSLLAIGLMVIILVMVLPMPSWVIDIGLTMSFALSILIFTTAIFVQKPLDFSSFPSILLASLILRLALNVSSTKLIIGQGHTGTAAAGGVIEGFANFVMGGNLFVGLVVFSVLVIVNFMVITKGAGRMAEVGARFALDAMPGKQMAIDSDLAVGAITHEEAKIRRQREQEEAAFLGSLDGASKFVKGDAIAGLMITALNLLAGIGFGVIEHQLSFTEALSNYSILTVGDGLVSQIPAVIVSVAAALLLSKGRDEGAIDLALTKQLAGNATPLLIVAGILGAFALLPGMPFVPFMGAAAAFGFGSFFIRKQAQEKKDADQVTADNVPPKPARIGDSIYSDEIHLEVSPDLVNLVLIGENGFESRIDKIRRYIAEEYGFVLPPIRMTDNPTLKKNEYRIRIQGVRIDSGFLRPGNVLALIEDNQLPHLQGEKVREPVYKAAARWLPNGRKQELAASGIPTVEPMEVLATHMLEVIQSNFSLVFTRMVMVETLEALTKISDTDRAQANQRFLDEYIPGKVTPEVLLSVLRLLLSERISIRNLFLIVETIAEVKPMALGVPRIVELVRQRLAFQIVDRLQDDQGRLPLVQLSAGWEQKFTEYEVNGDSGNSDIALPPELFGELITAIQTKLNETAQKGIVAAVATTSKRRRFLQTVLASKGIRNAVVAYEEISAKSKPYIIGVA